MDGRTDGKPNEREDGDTQVFYRFVHESSLGDGPQDPRWDSTGGAGRAKAGEDTSGIASQDRWNAFGRSSDEPSYSSYEQEASTYGQDAPSHGQEASPYGQQASSYAQDPSSYGQDASSYGQGGTSDSPSAWESSTESWSSSWGSQPESTWDTAQSSGSDRWEPAPRWEAAEPEANWEPGPPAGWDPAPRWESTPTPTDWDTTGSQLTTYGSWRPSPLNRGDSVVPTTREPGWSGEPTDGRRWEGLAGHDDRPPWTTTGSWSTVMPDAPSSAPPMMPRWRQDIEEDSGEISGGIAPVSGVSSGLSPVSGATETDLARPGNGFGASEG